MERKNYIESINNYIGDIYYSITQKGFLSLNYKSEFKNKKPEQILNMYSKNISREIINGKTLFGPQHDDLEFIVDKQIVKEYSSVGEQKNSVIAFKLAEIKYIRQILNKDPILILDDLFSELDHEKVSNILKLIDDELQTFITTTEIDFVSEELLNKSQIFHVVDGKVKEE